MKTVLVLLLLATTLAAAETVTSEVPVSDPRLAPDFDTYCTVHPDAPKAFAVCGKSGSRTYRYDLEPDGKPLLGTRTPYVFDPSIRTDDARFSVETIGATLFVRRAGSDAVVRFEGVTTPGLLTWNRGSLLLVTWSTSDNVMGALVDTNLNVVATPFAIMPLPTWYDTAAAGGKFVILGRKGDFGAGVPSAVVIDADGHTHAVVLPATYVSRQLIVSSGNDYLYVWQRDQQTLLAQRYTASGETAGGPTVVANAGTGSIWLTSVVWAGSDYLLSWQNVDFAWMRTLGGSPQLVDGGPKGNPVLTAGPAGVFLTLQWVGAQTIRRLDTNGAEYDLSYGIVGQTLPALAMDGSEATVVWNENGETRAGRVGIDGTRLDGAGVVLPVDLAGVSPSIAFDGVNSLVVWSSGVRVNGVFFNRNGRVAGDAFVIAQDVKTPGNPAVSWTGTQYVVTWRNSAGQGSGAMVTTSGVVTPFGYGLFIQDPTSSGGPRPVAVFQMWDGRTVESAGVFGAFLDALGEPFSLSDGTPSMPFRLLSQARVVSNGRDYLATWVSTNSSSAARAEAWIARVDDRGRPKGQPFVVSVSTTSSLLAQAIPLFDGNDYRVVASDGAGALFIARIDDAAIACGCLTDKIAIPLDFNLRLQTRLFAAAASPDAIAVAYERVFTNDAVYGSQPRIFIRFIRTPPPPRHRAAGR